MSSRRGQSTLELALVLPLLLLLVLGIVDLGRVFVASNSLTHASREAARYGSLNWNDYAGICNRLISAAGNSGVTVDPTKITITFLDGGNPANTIDTVVFPNPPDICSTSTLTTASPCPRAPATCYPPIPGDLIQVSVAVPWSAQTTIIQNLLPAGFQVKGTTSSVIEQ